MFEWYDFYLYASMAAIIEQAILLGGERDNGFYFALLAFAAGFAVRPFGAIVFGRLGDIVGPQTHIPDHDRHHGRCNSARRDCCRLMIGRHRAPIILIGLRLLQGLAVGGEYGGAATYIAEHAPHGQRGYYTS